MKALAALVGQWLVYDAPLWVQLLLLLVPALAVLLVIFRFFGLKVAAQVGGGLLAVIAAFGAIRGARQAGWNERKEADDKANDAFVQDFKETANEAEARSDTELDGRNSRWLRD